MRLKGEWRDWFVLLIGVKTYNQQPAKQNEMKLEGAINQRQNNHSFTKSNSIKE